MTADIPTPPNLRPDAFVGAAADYVRYRLPYPKPLLQSFLVQAALPAAEAKLIDLACGSGRLALAIADRFDEILAVDQEPEMIEAGRREAARSGVRHIRWRIGRAEDLDAPAGRFDLVTVGEAFHRLNRTLVANKAFGWLKPGGAFVTLGCESFIAGNAPWRRAIVDAVNRFVRAPAQRSGDKPYPTLAEAIADEEAVLDATGFVEIATRHFTVPHEWDLPDLLGNLRSTSVLSRNALGTRQATFEAEVSAALLAFDPAGRYAEQIRCGYTFARKPR